MMMNKTLDVHNKVDWRIVEECGRLLDAQAIYLSYTDLVRILRLS